LISRIEGTQRYRVTDSGLDTAKFLVCVQDRVLRTSLAELATEASIPAGLRAAANVYTVQRNAGCDTDITINPKLRLAAQWRTNDVLNNRALEVVGEPLRPDRHGRGVRQG
jgi:hypothetical protein